MRHGLKTHYVSIMQPVQTINAMRELSNDYTQWHAAWAAYEVRRGGEVVNRQEGQSFVNGIFTFAWDDVINPFGNGERIKPEHALLEDGRNFDIDFIDDGDMKRRMVRVFVILKRDPQ